LKEEADPKETENFLKISVIFIQNSVSLSECFFGFLSAAPQHNSAVNSTNISRIHRERMEFLGQRKNLFREGGKKEAESENGVLLICE
jgi:hypothetical protein